MRRHSGRGIWTKRLMGYLANALLFRCLFESAFTMHNGLISVRSLRHRLHHANTNRIRIRMDVAGRLHHWENPQANMPLIARTPCWCCFCFKKCYRKWHRISILYNLLLFVGTRHGNMSFQKKWCFCMGVPRCRFRKKRKNKTKPKAERGFQIF